MPARIQVVLEMSNLGGIAQMPVCVSGQVHDFVNLVRTYPISGGSGYLILDHVEMREYGLSVGRP